MTSTTTIQANEATGPGNQPRRVSIQGYAGAFHESATRLFYTGQDVEIVPAHTFDEVVEQVLSGEKSDGALMAIENTLVGSLMTNYLLLQEHELRITGEVYLRIQQNLMVLPGTTLADLREVYSHPVAIAQCRKFFRDYPHIRLIEAADTALSARHVQEMKDPSRGAIAGTTAAELYDLEILAAGIETNKLNHTRFLVLEKGCYDGQDQGNKVSLSFTTPHESGCLYRVLAILAAYQINLTKIQSRPIVGRPWEYRFFVDFVAEGKVGWQQALEGVGPITKDLRVLGVYQQGIKP
ncbi:prephenate dehydratase [Lewinellaceae bacterium SD302]|nr:prephenate dehydratase [Lewinellaceae bacterium SD302]